MNTENNKLIAEFMGVFDKILSTGNIYSWSDAPFFYTTEDSKEKVMENIAKYSKYHSDWNWLMGVVEKIESLGFVFKMYGKGSTFLKKGTSNQPIWNDEFTGTDKKESVYNACLELIKWNNSKL